MDSKLRIFLDNLHAEGVEYDATRTNRLERRRNLDPETTQFIAMQLRLISARRVVEVGTSIGYGTIWLADAMRETGGSVSTLDVAPQAEAQANAQTAGVHGVIEFIQRDAGEYRRSWTMLRLMPCFSTVSVPSTLVGGLIRSVCWNQVD